MSADDDLARFIREIVRDTDRTVRLFREAPGYKPPHPPGREREEAFKELDAQDKSERQIALALHVTCRTVTRWRAKFGTSRDYAKPHPKDARQFAARLVEDECPRAEIARTIGANVETIARWFPDTTWRSRTEAVRFLRETGQSKAVEGDLGRSRMYL